ncbi:uncharacterized protein LOC120083621 [Benincasa hispida]|uniref:uncharacterized protein LOC120083621 n=1 Tax=Benincasa hispida TaxID=102211 RepID=UPI001902691F|nr:uncharacterized protein LOC120083621 [Benincasa hispida]
MELNEDLGFGENPFNGSLKRHCSSHLIMETNRVMRREGDDHEDESNGSCGFHREILFPTMNTTCQPPTNNNNCNVFSPNSTSYYSNDNVLDVVEILDVHRHHHLTVMAERKLRRMISNRESARRSRMRKKKQIEELQYQVGQLEVSNRQLSEKLIQVVECNQQILHENAELKRKVSSLQIILTDFLTPLRNCEDAFGNSIIKNRRDEPNSS